MSQPSTHHSGGATALDVLHDTVEDADAAADGEQQYGQECAHGPDTPSLPAGNEPGFGPMLLGALAAVAVAEWYRDISRWQLWLVRSAGPGFHGNNEQAGEQQHKASSVQGLVEGEGIFYGRRSGQVAACEYEAAVGAPSWSAIVVSRHTHMALGTYHGKKSAFLSMTAALLVGVLYGCGTAQQRERETLRIVLGWRRQPSLCAER